MSAKDSIENLASLESFREFCETVAINGADDAQAIIDRSVDVVDTDGNVRHVAALVHVIKAEFPSWNVSDLVEADSGNVRLRQTIQDDGYIQRIEASPVA